MVRLPIVVLATSAAVNAHVLAPRVPNPSLLQPDLARARGPMCVATGPHHVELNGARESEEVAPALYGPPGVDGPANGGSAAERALADLALAVDGGSAGEPSAATDDDPHAAVLEADDPDRPPISMFNVDAATVSILEEQGITNFTPIQAQSYDMLRAGHDMLGRSRTGTGKTLAFSLPLVQRLAEEQRQEQPVRGRRPRMVVLAPTRELARQVGDVINMLGKPHRMQVHTFVGGTPYPPQQRALRNGIFLAARAARAYIYIYIYIYIDIYIFF